jgi:hypothetical protein
LSLAGQAQACRISSPPKVTYDQWVETADRIVLGRVASVGRVQETDAQGGEWTRPMAEVEGIRVLRGALSPDRISLRSNGLMTVCYPTIHSEISDLTVGDEVVVMLDENDAVLGLMKANLDTAQTYIARLTPSAE